MTGLPSIVKQEKSIYERYLERLEQRKLSLAEEAERRQAILLEELAKRHEEERLVKDFSFKNTRRAL